MIQLKALLFGAKWLGGLAAAGAVSWAAYYVTSTLLSVGSLETQLKAQTTAVEQFRASDEALRTEIKALSTAVSARQRADLVIEKDFAAIVDAALEGREHACDPEPLDPVYVEQLRIAAQRAAATSEDLSVRPGSVDATDVGAGASTHSAW